MARMPAGHRRQQLLDVAAALFARKGYSGTTTSELAHEAGVTEPILYHHFDGKQALFATLVDEIGRDLIENWRRALTTSLTAEERLSMLLTSNPMLHARGQNDYRILFHAMTANVEDPEIRSILRRHLRKLHRFVKAELVQLQELDHIHRTLDLETVSWMLVHMAIGYAMIGPVNVTGHHKANSDGRIVKAISAMLSV